MTVALTLLGDVRWRGAPVAGERPQALLAALAAAGGRPVRTKRLIDLVWGDEAPADAALSACVPASEAFPGDVSGDAAAVEVCRAVVVPSDARGAGASIGGNAVGRGVVLDCARPLNRSRELDPGARTGFTLMALCAGARRSEHVGFVGGVVGWCLVDGVDEIDRYAQTFEQQRTAALSPDETRRWLRLAIKSMGGVG